MEEWEREASRQLEASCDELMRALGKTEPEVAEERRKRLRYRLQMAEHGEAVSPFEQEGPASSIKLTVARKPGAASDPFDGRQN